MAERSHLAGIMASVSLLALAACNSGSDGPAASASPGGSAGTAGSGGDATAAGGGACTGTDLFAARPYGTDGDLIRHIEVDPASGDLFFSTLDDIYRVPPSGGEPALVAARPSWSQLTFGTFYVRDGELLFPSEQAIAEEGRLTVLWSMPLEGGEPEAVVTIPGPSDDTTRYAVDRSFIEGDDVVWVDERFVLEFNQLGPQDEVYHVRRTSWRAPAEPFEWYTTERSINGILLSGSTGFVNEDADDQLGGENVQRIIDLGSGAISSDDTVTRYGGKVIAADGESLLINHDDFEDVSTLGVYRVAPDGSGSEKIMDSPALETFAGVVRPIIHRDGLWLVSEYDFQADQEVLSSYAVGQGKRRVGCIDVADATLHALAFDDAAVYAAVFRDNESATIVRLER